MAIFPAIVKAEGEEENEAESFLPVLSIPLSVVVSSSFLEPYPGERSLLEFILSLTDRLGMTSKYAAVISNEVRDLFVSEPLPSCAETPIRFLIQF
jgi:hypothetical protein